MPSLLQKRSPNGQNKCPQVLNSVLNLTEFITACVQTNLPLALEVRHLDWFKPEYSDRLNNLLTELNIARVLLDTRPIYNCPDDPQLDSPRKKPKLPLQPVSIGNMAFIRFISHPNWQYNQTYLEQWAIKLQDWIGKGKTVYFFVHCPKKCDRLTRQSAFSYCFNNRQT